MSGPSPARLADHAPVAAPLVVQEEWGLDLFGDPDNSALVTFPWVG